MGINERRAGRLPPGDTFAGRVQSSKPVLQPIPSQISADKKPLPAQMPLDKKLEIPPIVPSQKPSATNVPIQEPVKKPIITPNLPKQENTKKTRSSEMEGANKR